LFSQIDNAILYSYSVIVDGESGAKRAILKFALPRHTAAGAALTRLRRPKRETISRSQREPVQAQLDASDAANRCSSAVYCSR
jgi:hypothetical protein